MKLLKKVKGSKLLEVLFFFLLGVLFFLDHYKERTAIKDILILSIFIVHYQLTEVSNSPDHGAVDNKKQTNLDHFLVLSPLQLDIPTPNNVHDFALLLLQITSSLHIIFRVPRPIKDFVVTNPWIYQELRLNQCFLCVLISVTNKFFINTVVHLH